MELAMVDIFAATDDGVGREWGQVGWRKGGGNGGGDAAFGLDTVVPVGDGRCVLANHCRHQVPLGDGAIKPADATGLADSIDVGDGRGEQGGGGDGGGGGGASQGLGDVEIGDEVVAEGDIIAGELVVALPLLDAYAGHVADAVDGSDLTIRPKGDAK